MPNSSRNLSSFIAFDTTGTVAALMEAGVKMPWGGLLSELSRVLGATLEAYLNGKPFGAASLRYGSRLFYQLAMEGHEAVLDTTRAGDRFGRVGTLVLEDEVPEALAEGYRVWHEQVLAWARSEAGKGFMRSQWKKAGLPYDDRTYEGHDLSDVRRFIESIRATVSPFCKEFVVHGSLSDMKRTSYSDLDTWMVVSREIVKDPIHLKDLRQSLQVPLQIAKRFDPLQHHGIFVSTPIFADR